MGEIRKGLDGRGYEKSKEERGGKGTERERGRKGEEKELGGTSCSSQFLPLKGSFRLSFNYESIPTALPV